MLSRTSGTSCSSFPLLKMRVIWSTRSTISQPVHVSGRRPYRYQSRYQSLSCLLTSFLATLTPSCAQRPPILNGPISKPSFPRSAMPYHAVLTSSPSPAPSSAPSSMPRRHNILSYACAHPLTSLKAPASVSPPPLSRSSTPRRRAPWRAFRTPTPPWERITVTASRRAWKRWTGNEA